MALGMAVSFLSAVNLYFFQHILDHAAFEWTLFWIVGYAATLLMIPVLSYLAEYPFSKLQYGIYYFLKKEALRKMSTIDYLSYLENSSGVMLQKIEAGANAGRNIYVDFYCRLFREIIPEAVFNVFFIALIEIKLVPFILAGYVFVFILTRLLLTFLYSFKEAALIDEEHMNRTLVRGFTELLTFRVNRRYQKELKKYEELSENATDHSTKVTMIHEAFFALFFFFVCLLKILLLILFFNHSLSITIGGFVALLAYIDKIYSPIAIFNVLFVQYRLDKIAYERLERIYDYPDDPKLVQHLAAINKIECIAVDHISFSIGNKKVIEQFSLELNKGYTYALVGKSGSGKSTLLNIIMGLLPVDTGAIRFNSQTIDSLAIDSIYSRIFYISQDAPIFEGSLRENIVFEKEVADHQIEEVLVKCQLDDFYRKCPHQLDTRIGERGTTLSGGERQRVAFARLFFAEVDVIILDEATSALDYQTEQRLMEEVAGLFQDKIVIMVTHKKKELYLADKIISLS